MKQKEKKHKNNEVMEGYNPRIYRRLSMLFGILTILNLVVIMYAFALTGYGLWHAEDALSYVAKIDSNMNSINQNILKIALNEDNTELIQDSAILINSKYAEITETPTGYAEKFRQIDLKNIDTTISGDFEQMMSTIDTYYTNVSGKLKAVKDGKAKADTMLDAETEELQAKATEQISALVKKQDTSTYDFFCRIGQRFLLVPLFLILTMSAGLFAISKSRKRDYEFAVNLQSSKRKTDNMHKKVKALAYTNVLTGLKNRYAFTDMLKERLKKEDVDIVLYSFDNFKTINEYYGREFADEFILAVSQQLVENYGGQADIFSTETDELCVMFHSNIQKSQSLSFSFKILDLLSRPYQIRGAVIQLNVAGCSCHAHSNTNASDATIIKLFTKIDHTLNQAIIASITQNKSQLLSVQET